MPRVVNISRLIIVPVMILTLVATTAESPCATPRIAAGGDHTAVIRPDGSLWSWGENVFGQVGDGTVNLRNIPIKIGTDVTWTNVSAGLFHTAAIKADGSLWVWGDNSRGQLGVGSAVPSVAAPVRVGTETNWAAVSAGDFHTLALKTDGSLWGWGDNSTGQVGDGSVVPGIQYLPLQIVLPSPSANNDWVAIAAGGGHSLALKSNRTVWTWGFNGSGQLGNGTNIDQSAPLVLLQPSPAVNNAWVNLAAGRLQSLALKNDGTLWLWGENSSGQLGSGTAVNSAVPTQENNPSSNWLAASSGDSHAVGRKSDGTLWSWGNNASGQLGIGNTIDSNVPNKIGADSDWLSVAAGYNHTVALKTSGAIWAWGENGSGQLGDGTNLSRNSPVAVSQARFLPKGDLNQNGVVDLGDALQALRIVVGLVPQTADDLILGDVTPQINGVIVPDGSIDLTDALQILRKVVGIVNF